VVWVLGWWEEGLLFFKIRSGEGGLHLQQQKGLGRGQSQVRHAIQLRQQPERTRGKAGRASEELYPKTSRQRKESTLSLHSQNGYWGAGASRKGKTKENRRLGTSPQVNHTQKCIV